MTLFSVIIVILLASGCVWKVRDPLWKNIVWYLAAVLALVVIAGITYGVITQHPDVPISSGVYIHK